MALRGWSWDAVAGPAGAGHRPLLEALEAALPDAAVEDAIERTGGASGGAGCCRRTWW